ncbi:MAG: DNA-deoxyinosine glycosylase [Cellvibrionales bacterium]|nr:DNA-deoxyinosine glycosylase [Cellvibrionales bacterium]
MPDSFHRGFAPVINQHTQVLVLGSMPSVKSLADQAYYAHPRNAFWPLMGELFDFNANDDYTSRLNSLLAVGVGLWDVYAACERPGSLDSAIVNSTAEFNDFVSLFAKYPEVRVLAFNGKTAFTRFERLAKNSHDLANFLKHKKLLCLPSTSPANATLSINDKQVAWQSIRGFLLNS